MDNLSDNELVSILKQIKEGDNSHPEFTKVCKFFFGCVPRTKEGFKRITKKFYYKCVEGLKKMGRYIDLRKYGFRSHQDVIEESVREYLGI